MNSFLHYTPPADNYILTYFFKFVKKNFLLDIIFN